MSRHRSSDMRFHGLWIGETQGCASPAHRWEIAQQGPRLLIRTAWEGEPPGPSFYARVLPDEPGFRLAGFKASLVDAQHFIIPGWDTNDTRGGVGPAYDVVFSRPGLAELTAHAVWCRYRAQQEAGDAGDRTG